MDWIFKMRHGFFRLTGLYFTFMLVLIPWPDLSIAHAASYQHHRIDKGWGYYWGNIRIGTTNELPDHTMAQLESLPWKKMPYKDSLENPPGRKGRHRVWMRVQLPDKTLRDPVLFVDWFSYAAEVYQGKRCIYRHHTVGQKKSGRFDGIPPVIIPLLEDRPIEPVYFRIYSTDPFFIGMDEVFYGDRSDFIIPLIKEEFFSILLGIFFILFGIQPLFVLFSPHKNKVRLYFGLCIISLGITTLDGYLWDLWMGPSFLWYAIFNIAQMLTMISLSLYFERLLPASVYNKWLKPFRLFSLFSYTPAIAFLMIIRPSYIYYELLDFFIFGISIVMIIMTYLSCIHAALKREIQKLIAFSYTILVISALNDIFTETYFTYPWTMLIFVLTLSYINENRTIKYYTALRKSEVRLLESRLETLKSQINPHFLFNSLNTLSSLIFIDKERAAGCVEALATVYRNILETRNEPTISLKKELKLSDAYVFLIKTRFGEGLIIEKSIDESCQEKKIASLSIQIVIENAIKHNIVSAERPLHIEILTEHKQYLLIRNNLQRKNTKADSLKIGLENINKRYSFLADQHILVEETNEAFIVKIPLLNNTDSKANR